MHERIQAVRRRLINRAGRDRRRRRRDELLPACVRHGPEVDEGLDVLAVDARHGVADRVEHLAVARSSSVGP